MHASLILTPSNTTLFWSIFPYVIGKNSEIIILTVKDIQLEQLKKQTWKVQSRTGSNLLFQLLKLNTFNCKPCMVTVVTSEVHTIYFTYIHLRWKFSLQGIRNCFIFRSTNNNNNNKVLKKRILQCMEVSVLFTISYFPNLTIDTVKKKSFNLNLKQSTVEHCLIIMGKSFQGFGAMTEKDLSP